MTSTAEIREALKGKFPEATIRLAADERCPVCRREGYDKWGLHVFRCDGCGVKWLIRGRTNP